MAAVSSAAVNRWTTQGPYGRAGFLLLDPRDPDIVYAANTSGVFKSTDAAVHFSLLNHGLPTASTNNAVAVSPADSSIVFLGRSPGLYRSQDGGRSWDPASFGLGDPSDFVPPNLVAGIVIDPTNPSVVFAGTLGGVYKSLDGGCTWSKRSQGLVPDAPDTLYINGISMDPADPSVLYVATFHGIYKSNDSAGSWLPANRGLPAATSGVVLDPLDPSTLYTATSFYSDTNPLGSGGVYRSRDGGASWSLLTGLPDIGFRSVAVAQESSSTLYAGSLHDGVWKSTDGGTTWGLAGLEGTEVNQILTSSRPGEILTSTSLGIFRSFDGGANWLVAGRGIGDVSSTVAVDPSDARNVFAASDYSTGQRSGIHKSSDGGQTWDAHVAGLPPSRSIRALAIDPVTPSTIYAAHNRMVDETECHPVYKSVDGGITWSPAETQPTAFFCNADIVLVDPANPSRVVAANGGVQESLDGGKTWRTLSGMYCQTALALDPTNPAILYSAALSSIYKSIDGGATAQLVSVGGVYALVLKPGNPQFLYAGTYDQGILKSIDGGVSWMPSGLDGKWIYDILFDPAHPETAFALVVSDPDPGIVATFDDGATWAPFVPGLPEPAVRLAIDASGKKLFAVAGSGIFDLTRSDAKAPVLTSIEPASGPASGGTRLTLRGADFSAGAAVAIGEGAASDVALEAPDRLAVTVPPGQAGASLVRVTNADGQVGEAASRFVYDFEDVAPEALEHGAVVHLAARGITLGCGGGGFCPGAPVNRASLAALLEKSIHPPGFVYPVPGAFLSDVGSCDPFAKFIYQLEAEGLTLGCGANLFCPDAPIRRDQMAGFLARALAGGDDGVPSSGNAGGFAYSCVAGASGASRFEDVAPDADFCRHINFLAARGVAIGCDAVPNFCPSILLTRGDAAIFLDRAFPVTPGP